MIVPSDFEYIDTKQIKLGLKTLNSPLKELADRLEFLFGTRPINIIHDRIKHSGIPRLWVIYERTNDVKSLTSSPFSRPLPEIEEQIKSEFESATGGYPGFDADRLYVLIMSFEPLARQEACNNIRKHEIEMMKETLASLNVWEVRQWSHTFLFYTDEQAKRAKYDGTEDKLRSAFFELMKQYDEFGYITKETTFIRMNSKEIFDSVYQGNWFYFDRD